jgi:hypothetical protein
MDLLACENTAGKSNLAIHLLETVFG